MEGFVEWVATAHIGDISENLNVGWEQRWEQLVLQGPKIPENGILLPTSWRTPAPPPLRLRLDIQNFYRDVPLQRSP